MEKKSEDVSTYSFVIDLLERTPMVGIITSLYHYLRKDTEKCKVCLKKHMKFFMNMFKVIPGIGHLIGVFCYIFGCLYLYRLLALLVRVKLLTYIARCRFDYHLFALLGLAKILITTYR